MQKIKQALYRFMAGRYGTDQLNMVMLWLSLALMILGSLLSKLPLVGFLLALCSLVLIVLANFRCFSRNVSRRYEENRRFLRWKDRFTDRKHRYYKCPRCHGTVRVPRGKGKIAITCPRCAERFIKKS